MIVLLKALSLFLFCIALTGIVSLCVFGRRYKRKKAGLIFHVLQSDKRDRLSCYDPQMFSLLLYHLKTNNFSVVPPNLGLVNSSAQISDINRTICIIFDDGLSSFIDDAVPILDKYNYKAAVFPVTAYIGTKSTWDVYSALKALNRQQITQLAAQGHEIGSHTHTHPNLTFLSNSDIKNELKTSKDILEEITGKPVITLSFPFGCYNSRVWDIARSCGYSTGITYRNVPLTQSGIYSFSGVYAFDTLNDILQKITNQSYFSFSRTQSRLLPHFAQGTPMWKFRTNYAFFR